MRYKDYDKIILFLIKRSLSMRITLCLFVVLLVEIISAQQLNLDTTLTRATVKPP